MTNTLIYINNTIVDIGPETVVATSYKSLDIGDINKRSASYTNKLKIPKTEQNIITFGFSDNIKSTSRNPYISLPAKIIQNGIETIRSGTAVIFETNTNFEVNIYSGVYGFFESLGDKKLIDLDLLVYDSTDGSPYLFLKKPFINYGNLDEDETPLLQYSGNELWSFSYKVLIEEIISQNGYEKQGNVFDDDKLDVMYLSALGLNYNENFSAPKEFEALVADAGAVVNLSGITSQKIPFTNVVKSSNFYDNVNTYTVQDVNGGLFGGTYFIYKGFAHLEFTITDNTIANTVTIELFSNLTGVYQFAGLSNGTYSFVFEISDKTIGNISGIEGSQLYMRARCSTGGGSATLTATGGFMKNEVLGYSGYTSVNGIMPDMLQKDLLKDFAMRFGVMFDEDNGTLICKTISEIIKSRSTAKDWTQKRDTSTEDRNRFEFNSYSINNYLKYSHQDDELPEDFGNGNIAIDNVNLSAETTIYQSPFNNTDTRLMGNVSAGKILAAYIPVYIDGNVNDPGLRIIMIRNRQSFEAAELVGGITSYEVGYFSNFTRPTDPNLDMQRFITDHYSEFALAIQDIKYIDRWYNLTDVDMGSLNLLGLIYDDGDYFLINQINNFVPGIVTKVELLKVS